MIWLTPLLVSLLIFVSCALGQTSSGAKRSSSTAAFSISVTSPSGPVHLGSPITLKVTVKNISGGVIGWESAHRDTAYQAFNVVLQQNGQNVGKTAFHRKLKNQQRIDDPPDVENTDTTLFPLAPGQSLNFTINLDQLYQITQSGTYTLDVNRFDESSKTTVHAKSIRLHIVP